MVMSVCVLLNVVFCVCVALLRMLLVYIFVAIDCCSCLACLLFGVMLVFFGCVCVSFVVLRFKLCV